jgi:hypothetical protein
MVSLVLLGGLLLVLGGVGIYAAMYREDRENRSASGDAKAGLVGGAILPLAVLSPLLTSLPPAWKLYAKLHKWSAWQMQKASNADAIANVRRPNGKEVFAPAKYVEGSEDDKELSGYKVLGLGDKRYDPAIHGESSNRYGKADLVHINEDDPEQASWADCAIDNAFALDRERYLFRDASVRMVLDAGASADQAAVADGGTETQPRLLDLSVEKPGILHDALVPITSRAGYDGQLISWNQHASTKQEKADQEAIRAAKNAGWMAAKLDDIDGVDLMKWVLILGAIGVMLLFNNEIGAMIANFGGGGGGGGAISGALGMLLPASLRRGRE